MPYPHSLLRVVSARKGCTRVAALRPYQLIRFSFPPLCLSRGSKARPISIKDKILPSLRQKWPKMPFSTFSSTFSTLWVDRGTKLMPDSCSAWSVYYGNMYRMPVKGILSDSGPFRPFVRPFRPLGCYPGSEILSESCSPTSKTVYMTLHRPKEGQKCQKRPFSTLFRPFRPLGSESGSKITGSSKSAGSNYYIGSKISAGNDPEIAEPRSTGRTDSTHLL